MKHKRLVPHRDPNIIPARQRKAGPHKDKRLKRIKQKELRELQESQEPQESQKEIE